MGEQGTRHTLRVTDARPGLPAPSQGAAGGPGQLWGVLLHVCCLCQSLPCDGGPDSEQGGTSGGARQAALPLTPA